MVACRHQALVLARAVAVAANRRKHTARQVVNQLIHKRAAAVGVGRFVCVCVCVCGGGSTGAPAPLLCNGHGCVLVLPTMQGTQPEATAVRARRASQRYLETGRQQLFPSSSTSVHSTQMCTTGVGSHTKTLVPIRHTRTRCAGPGFLALAMAAGDAGMQVAVPGSATRCGKDRAA